PAAGGARGDPCRPVPPRRAPAAGRGRGAAGTRVPRERARGRTGPDRGPVLRRRGGGATVRRARRVSAWPRAADAPGGGTPARRCRIAAVPARRGWPGGAHPPGAPERRAGRGGQREPWRRNGAWHRGGGDGRGPGVAGPDDRAVTPLPALAL